MDKHAIKAKYPQATAAFIQKLTTLQEGEYGKSWNDPVPPQTDAELAKFISTASDETMMNTLAVSALIMATA